MKFLRKRRDREGKACKTQPAESESKVRLEPEVVAASDGGIVSGYSEQPPQELGENLSINEPACWVQHYNCDSIL